MGEGPPERGRERERRGVKGRGGEGREGRKGRGEKEGEGREGKGKGYPPELKSWLRPWVLSSYGSTKYRWNIKKIRDFGPRTRYRCPQRIVCAFTRDLLAIAKFSFISLWFLQTLIDFYNIWRMVYRVIFNTTVINLPASPAYCCYTTLGKSQLRNIKFSNQSYTLLLHKIKIKF